MVSFGVGTVILGLGTLTYKVMVYDIAMNSEMKAFIDKAITTSEQKTEKAIPASQQKTKAELDNLKLALELTTQR
ncbi:hypothetical protein EV426DRAFT_608367 [Tirmania nivea]|nr:hypothetical protein EV426DRAFT_608367 [Tirmania nivea]